MTLVSRSLPQIAAALFTLMIGLTAANAFGQNTAGSKNKHSDFCSDNNWSSGDKVSARDLREMTVASAGQVNVDAGRNGGISVTGEDRNDVLIRACVQAWGRSEEAAQMAVKNVRIETNGTIKASELDENSSVSYQLLVPRNMNVNLTASNGGIMISTVDGELGFETTNGGVMLTDIAGNVKGRTKNGGVIVRLSGNTWKGAGLDVTTTNGGVKLIIPETYAAHVETGTVNGGFKSSIPALAVTTEDNRGESFGRTRKTTVSTNLNGGGPTIRVETTNGGVSISSPE